METIFAVFLVALTSLASYRIIQNSARSLRTALGDALISIIECVGAFVLFSFVNVALGAIIILVIRGFTPHFVALYELESLPLIVLSAVQAFVFQRCLKNGKLGNH